MANELYDIADKLKGYKDEMSWEITQAAKLANGSWELTIQPVEKEPKAPQEATDDNN